MCSERKWTLEFLEVLREKFLMQEYPADLINQQFERVLQLDRSELLLVDRNNRRKRKIICPLVVTYHPSNPPFRQWIQGAMGILHESEKMKKLVPHVSVTTRQGKNIAQTVIKTRHWRGGAGGGGGDGDDRGGGPGGDSRPPGNYKFHSKNCVTCDKMEDGQTSFYSDKTGRKYQIKRHYTCQDSWVVYYIRCTLWVTVDRLRQNLAKDI